MPSSGISHYAFTMFYVVDNKNQLYEVYMMLIFGRSVNFFPSTGTWGFAIIISLSAIYWTNGRAYFWKKC